jgi:hypothetical protein
LARSIYQGAQTKIQKTPTRTMNNTKAIIDFTDYSATELGTLAQLVHDQLDENAATFPNPPLTLANFVQSQINRTCSAL